MDKPKWWVPKIKPFVETDVWFCYDCDGLTVVETNDTLSNHQSDRYKYYGKDDRPKWVARCWECKEPFETFEYSCPDCGFWCDDERFVLAYSDPVFNVSKSMEFGGHPVDWEETVKCPKCDTIFTVMNSNC